MIAGQDSQLKSQKIVDLKELKCMSGNQATMICASKNCSRQAFCCATQNCKCNIIHEQCSLKRIKSFFSKIQSKLIHYQPILEHFNNKIYSFIDQISDIRDQVENSMIYYGLKQPEVDLLKLIKSKQSQKILGKQVYQADQLAQYPNKVNFGISTRIIDKFWENQGIIILAQFLQLKDKMQAPLILNKDSHLKKYLLSQKESIQTQSYKQSSKPSVQDLISENLVITSKSSVKPSYSSSGLRQNQTSTKNFASSASQIKQEKLNKILNRPLKEYDTVTPLLGLLTGITIQKQLKQETQQQPLEQVMLVRELQQILQSESQAKIKQFVRAHGKKDGQYMQAEEVVNLYFQKNGQA